MKKFLLFSIIASFALDFSTCKKNAVDFSSTGFVGSWQQTEYHYHIVSEKGKDFNKLNKEVEENIVMSLGADGVGNTKFSKTSSSYTWSPSADRKYIHLIAGGHLIVWKVELLSSSTMVLSRVSPIAEKDKDKIKKEENEDDDGEKYDEDDRPKEEYESYTYRRVR